MRPKGRFSRPLSALLAVGVHLDMPGSRNVLGGAVSSTGIFRDVASSREAHDVTKHSVPALIDVTNASTIACGDCDDCDAREYAIDR